ncbi:MAG: FmdB family zinc ribbon protein, partial [Acidimicrobiales bacterium]
MQHFSDPPLTTCPHCGGALRKVFSAVGIVFKGSGFYKTDSRSTSVSATPPGAAPSAPTPSTSAAPSTPAPS